MVNVSVNPVPETVETRSNSSSQTLVDKDDARSDQSYQKVDAVTESSSEPDMIVDTKEIADAQAQNGQTAAPAALNEAALPLPAPTETEHAFEQTESVDEKVLRALEYQKRSSGTDQQDVEEVMGSMINRLQAAIKPTTIDEKTGIQLEKIMETFFVTTVNYTKKFQEAEYQHEISFDRSITAFPAPEGPCSLYDALGRNFNQQILEDSNLSRYTAIRTLPPVLHVLIQRSQSMGSKNGNPVVIPETLYLDRFMDAPHQSPEFKRRVEDWMLAERIEDVKSQLVKVKNDMSNIEFLESYVSEASTQSAADGTNGQIDQENWDFDGPVEDDFLLVSPSAPSTAPVSDGVTRPQGIQATQTAVQQMMETELKQLEERLETHVEGMKNIPYRLHAVICHRGHLSSGHYWVWIHDFEENVWRWYNDADVKENKDTADVLKTLSTSGEPYYLCYVRDENKDEYVDVPKRQVPEQKDSDVEPVQLDQDGDVTLIDDTPTDAANTTRHSPSKSI
jgi:ubiquitin carboxyl-terminal hydrolase 25/28